MSPSIIIYMPCDLASDNIIYKLYMPSDIIIYISCDMSSEIIIYTFFDMSPDYNYLYILKARKSC